MNGHVYMESAVCVVLVALFGRTCGIEPTADSYFVHGFSQRTFTYACIPHNRARSYFIAVPPDWPTDLPVAEGPERAGAALVGGPAPVVHALEAVGVHAGGGKGVAVVERVEGERVDRSITARGSHHELRTIARIALALASFTLTPTMHALTHRTNPIYTVCQPRTSHRYRHACMHGCIYG